MKTLSYQPSKNALYLQVWCDKNFDDWDLLKQKLDSYTADEREVVVVHEGDEYIRQWAVLRRWTQKIFHTEPASEVVQFLADQERALFVCFWDGVNLGTEKRIKLARKLDLKRKVVRYD